MRGKKGARARLTSASRVEKWLRSPEVRDSCRQSQIGNPGPAFLRAAAAFQTLWKPAIICTPSGAVGPMTHASDRHLLTLLRIVNRR